MDETLLAWNHPWGGGGNKPVCGDFNGDGTSEIAVYREGLWAVRDLTRVYFGTSGDSPIPGDYNGDGSKDIGIFRPSNGLWAIRDLPRVYFGRVSDIAWYHC